VVVRREVVSPPCVRGRGSTSPRRWLWQRWSHPARRRADRVPQSLDQLRRRSRPSPASLRRPLASSETVPDAHRHFSTARSHPGSRRTSSGRRRCAGQRVLAARCVSAARRRSSSPPCLPRLHRCAFSVLVTGPPTASVVRPVSGRSGVGPPTRSSAVSSAPPQRSASQCSSVSLPRPVWRRQPRRARRACCGRGRAQLLRRTPRSGRRALAGAVRSPRPPAPGRAPPHSRGPFQAAGQVTEAARVSPDHPERVGRAALQRTSPRLPTRPARRPTPTR